MECNVKSIVHNAKSKQQKTGKGQSKEKKRNAKLMNKPENHEEHTRTRTETGDVWTDRDEP